MKERVDLETLTSSQKFPYDLNDPPFALILHVERRLFCDLPAEVALNNSEREIDA